MRRSGTRGSRWTRATGRWFRRWAGWIALFAVLSASGGVAAEGLGSEPIPHMGGPRPSATLPQKVMAVASYAGQYMVTPGTGESSGVFHAYVPIAPRNGHDVVLHVQNGGDAQAQVQVALLDSGGSLVHQAAASLAPHAGSGHDLSKIPSLLPASPYGAVISSDQPVYAVLDIEATDGSSLMSTAGLTRGSSAIALPMITRADFGWDTLFLLQNVGDAAAGVTMIYHPMDFGGADYVATDTIPISGTHIYRQEVMPQLGASFSGWAQVESSAPLVAAALLQQSASDSGAAYTGAALDDLETAFLIPRQHNSTAGWASTVWFINAGQQDASITSTWYSTDGAALWSETKPASALGNPVVYFLPAVLALPPGLDGVLLGSATRPLVPLALQQNPTVERDGYTLALGSGLPDGSPSIALPRVAHVAAQGRSTELSIQNGADAPATVTITFYHQDGTPTAVMHDSIAGWGCKRYATRDVAALGQSWEGSIVVQADQPIAAEVMQFQGTRTYELFLPLLTQPFPHIPDTPTLYSIDNPSGDDAYSVRWSSARWAERYELEEDDEVSFPSPWTVYTGPGTSVQIVDQPPGAWSYRVRACSESGCSGWSDPQSTTVRAAPSELYAINDTGDTLCLEVYDTGIGQKCFSGGEHFYGQFPPGTYSYCASAWCGSKCDTEEFDSGRETLQFWCASGAPALTLRRSTPSPD